MYSEKEPTVFANRLDVECEGNRRDNGNAKFLARANGKIELSLSEMV